MDKTEDKPPAWIGIRNSKNVKIDNNDFEGPNKVADVESSENVSFTNNRVWKKVNSSRKIQVLLAIAAMATIFTAVVDAYDLFSAEVTENNPQQQNENSEPSAQESSDETVGIRNSGTDTIMINNTCVGKDVCIDNTEEAVGAYMEGNKAYP